MLQDRPVTSDVVFSNSVSGFSHAVRLWFVFSVITFTSGKLQSSGVPEFHSDSRRCDRIQNPWARSWCCCCTSQWSFCLILSIKLIMIRAGKIFAENQGILLSKISPGNDLIRIADYKIENLILSELRKAFATNQNFGLWRVQHHPHVSGWRRPGSPGLQVTCGDIAIQNSQRYFGRLRGSPARCSCCISCLHWIPRADLFGFCLSNQTGDIQMNFFPPSFLTFPPQKSHFP